MSIFLSADIKKDSTTTTSNKTNLIELLKEKYILTSSLSTIWVNTDGCSEQYIYASAIYLKSFMSQCYSFITNCGISAPGHGKEVVDGLNAIDKQYIYIN